MRDNLDSLSQVVTATFCSEYSGVDRASRGIRSAGQVLVDEPFVMAQVEVRFTPILGHKNFAMLKRVHRARIDIDVRVEFLHRDPKAAIL